jgi:hypothetical protein
MQISNPTYPGGRTWNHAGTAASAVPCAQASVLYSAAYFAAIALCFFSRSMVS